MDDDIRDAVRAGRYRDAFERLLPRYRERVFRLACGILRQRAEAEDATQDVFLSIWRGLPAYTEAAELSTWIYAITRNTCVSALRKRHPELSLDGADGCSELLPAAEAAPNTATLSVLALLDQLPEKQRHIVTLFYFEDRSCEQVAQLLGVPVGTVKALLHRARRKLIELAGESVVAEQ